jgi:hypothetical protein
MRLASGSRPLSLVCPAVETKSDKRVCTVLPGGRRARKRPNPISPATSRQKTNSVTHDRQILFPRGC